jgi:hypothetical protein
MKTKKNLLTSLALSAVILLTLVLISGITMGEHAVASTSDLSTAVISAVQSVTTSTSTVTLGSSPNPIGTSVNIDIRIDDVSVGFWGWAVPTVTWNPAFLNLTKVQGGPFLSDNNESETTDFMGASNQLFDYYRGIIDGGLSEGILGGGLSTGNSGVLATLTFLVTATGSSTIGIKGGYLIPYLYGANASVDVACNNATIVVLANNSSPSPTPTSATPNPASTSPPPSNPTPTSSSTTKPSSSPNQSPSSSPLLSTPEFPAGTIMPIIIIVITIIVVPAFLWKKKGETTSNRLKDL